MIDFQKRLFIQVEETLQPPLEEVWPHGKGQDSWQSRKTSVCERTSHLYNNTEMSDLDILACDENWWFGQTVKDYIVSFKFSMLVSSSD
jgi:hypothetical protein